MAKLTDEARYSAQLRGLRASADLDVAKPLLATRRDNLIRDAILTFRDKKLDGVGAMLLVAALSENLQLLDDLEHAERQGRRAATQLHQV